MGPIALAAASPGRLLSELLPWLLLLLGIIVLSAIVVHFARRSTQADEAAPEEGFTLHGLRQMHACGDLSDEEFERAKAALISATRGETSENASRAKPDPTGSGPAST